MQDCELEGRILGIAAPWRVERVELQLKQGEVHVYLAHENQLEWPCAECGASCALYDHQAERQWRHLDTCQYRTILHAAPPRSQCSEHGARVVQLPWAEPNSAETSLQTLAAKSDRVALSSPPTFRREFVGGAARTAGRGQGRDWVCVGARPEGQNAGEREATERYCTRRAGDCFRRQGRYVQGRLASVVQLRP
jgi:zinc-finger of transposase IS204/IS1001/IS1096/IS1165